MQSAVVSQSNREDEKPRFILLAFDLETDDRRIESASRNAAKSAHSAVTHTQTPALDRGNAIPPSQSRPRSIHAPSATLVRRSRLKMQFVPPNCRPMVGQSSSASKQHRDRK